MPSPCGLAFPLTFQHRAGVSPYTSPFGFAETCVFVKQLPGPFHCGLRFRRHPFFRSYGVNMPSSLTTLLPLALGSSPHLPVSVCGTGAYHIHIPFLAACFILFPTLISVPLSGPDTNCRSDSTFVSVYLSDLAATESPPCVHRLRLSASP